MNNISDILPTVLIVGEKGNPVRINQSDFDKDVHKLFKADPKAAVVKNPLKALTVKELKTLADKEEIDVKGLKKEDEIIAAIDAARAAKLAATEYFAFPDASGKFKIVDKEGNEVGDALYDTEEAAKEAIKGF